MFFNKLVTLYMPSFFQFHDFVVQVLVFSSLLYILFSVVLTLHFLFTNNTADIIPRFISSQSEDKQVCNTRHGV